MDWLYLQGLFFSLYLFCNLFLVAGIFRNRIKARPKMALPDVTIIIVARNEETHIRHCLQAVARQTYQGSLQVVVVDDHSTDTTLEIIDCFAHGRKNWRVIEAPPASNWRSHKRNALAAATAQATGELFFLTDADCLPPPTWVEKTVAAWATDTIIIAGFSPLFHSHGGGWHQFLYTASLADALVSAGTIAWGAGATCTGRNLAYRRELLPAIDQYAALPDSLSGDDDFILQAATKQPGWKAGYSFDPDTHVPSPGPEDWRSFLQQKKRHLSAGRHYPWRQKTFYGLLHAGNLGVWLFAPLSLLASPWHLGLLLVKIAADGVSLSLLARRMRQKLRWLPLLCWEVLFPLYHLWCLPAAWRGRLAWKNRTS